MNSESSKNIQIFFQEVFANNALTHAYLFVGSTHEEKKHLIDWLLTVIPHEEHIAIVPRVSEKGTRSVIGVSETRDALKALQMSTFGGGRRIISIDQCELLNKEAGNTLLKQLEEPPDRTLFLLSARNHTALLPTIVSRCQLIRVGMPKSLALDPQKKLLFEQLYTGSLSQKMQATTDLSIDDLDECEVFIHHALQNDMSSLDILKLYDGCQAARKARAFSMSPRLALDHLWFSYC